MPLPNPFERFDLDPEEGPLGITERLRELAEAATSDAEREALRSAWEHLTRHPRERVRWALLAHPESRTPLPPLVAPRSDPPPGGPALPGPDDLRDPPSLEAALLAALSAAGAPPLPALDDALSPPLEHDPVLVGHLAREGHA